MSSTPTLVWIRLDLRLADHPSLHAACRRGGPVIPLYIWAPEEEGAWPPGAASRWWLHQSLARLSRELADLGAPLILRRGSSLAELLNVVRETGAGAVYWNRRYEPALLNRDSKIEQALRAAGLEVESFNSALLQEPWTIRNKSGRPFQVFTPYWRNCLASLAVEAPLPPPTHLVPAKTQPRSLPLAALELEPKLPWADGFNAHWQPGSAGAARELNRFLETGLLDYAENRDRPDRPGTSKLSPHLHFGEIGPRQIWHALAAFADARGIPHKSWHAWPFVTELGWREFAHHLLFHFPHTPDQPLRSEFARFPWRREPDWLRAWQRGRTGYPFVDAGLRQLWSTGWMHNRVRMVVASFLVKDLLLSWQEGARWFWDTLVDADLANNTLGWQWSAGCGADAAPFFRIFNPITQGLKFDPQGQYVRRWVPELASRPGAAVHRLESTTAPVEDYPSPIVGHALARMLALEALGRIKGSTDPNR